LTAGLCPDPLGELTSLPKTSIAGFKGWGFPEKGKKGKDGRMDTPNFEF